MSGDQAATRDVGVGDDGLDGVCGYVLAAGAGTRFGEPKIVAYQGGWLRLSTAALVGGGCDEVIVLMGARVIDPPAGTTALPVPDWTAGLSATVRRAVLDARDRRSAGMVLHVVDTPDVGADVVRRVLDASGGRRDALARAIFDGRPGHPVYLGADHLDGVLATLRGDAGAGPYLAAHEAAAIGVECGDLATGADHDVRR